MTHACVAGPAFSHRTDDPTRLRIIRSRPRALRPLRKVTQRSRAYGYIVGNLSDATVSSIVSRMDDLPRAFAAQSAGVPIGLTAPMIFQYADGVRFVAEAYRRGGRAAVDAIYADPPRATLQTCSPSSTSNIARSSWTSISTAIRRCCNDWSNADDDTYGAMLIKLIIQRNLGPNVPETALGRALDRRSHDRTAKA